MFEEVPLLCIAPVAAETAVVTAVVVVVPEEVVAVVLVLVSPITFVLFPSVVSVVLVVVELIVTVVVSFVVVVICFVVIVVGFAVVVVICFVVVVVGFAMVVVVCFVVVVVGFAVMVVVCFVVVVVGFAVVVVVCFVFFIIPYLPDIYIGLFRLICVCDDKAILHISCVCRNIAAAAFLLYRINDLSAVCILVQIMERGVPVIRSIQYYGLPVVRQKLYCHCIRSYTVLVVRIIPHLLHWNVNFLRLMPVDNIAVLINRMVAFYSLFLHKIGNVDSIFFLRKIFKSEVRSISWVLATVTSVSADALSPVSWYETV